MNDPLHDPRVRRVHDYLFVVEGSADTYDVATDERNLGEWTAGPAIGSQSSRRANLRNREGAEAWAQSTTTSHKSLHDALTYALTRIGAL